VLACRRSPDEPVDALDAGADLDEVRRRLAPAAPGDRLSSWIATLSITSVAGVLHLIGLARPRPPASQGKIFDEIDYATQGRDLFEHGVEWNPQTDTGAFVVHPPLGKWLVGVGEQVFGYNTFGWRVMPAVFGSLAVLILIRVTRRMFRSTVIGCAAGLLMTVDGMEFVLSRTALLDIFLMSFVLAAFGCLVMDRDQRRRRWLRAMEGGLDPTAPGRLGRLRTSRREAIPWWRLAAAGLTGCALAVKWSALWYVVLFVLLALAWEIGTRRAVGAPRPVIDALRDDSGWLVMFGVIVLVVYALSWSGWLLTSHGYDRHWLAGTGHHEYPFIGAWQNLWHYHVDEYTFDVALTQDHPYRSWPWQWLLLGRPVALYYSSAGGCGAASCASEVLVLGTPLLWWSFLPALVGVGAFAVARRDWRGYAIVLAAAAGIAPWFIWEFTDRTMFYFYALPALPFMVMAVVYLFDLMIRRWRRVTTALLGMYALAIVWCFAYFYPIFTAERITYAQWFARMWLGRRWI
jgi:dolichyl-phosphate-mannose-protein mannosyltransferase